MQAVTEQYGEKGSEQDADNATEGTQGDGFGQKLKKDVSAFRSNGLTHADFARALCDRNKHDVHHTDPAHQQPNRGNGKHQNENQIADLVPEIEEIVRGKKSEVVRLVVGEAAFAAQEVADFFNRFADHFGIAGLGKDHIVFFVGIELTQGGHGHDGDVVFGVRAAGNALTALFESGDHRKELAIDDHFFPDGGGCSFGEENVGGVEAEQHDRCSMLGVGVIEFTSISYLDVENL